MIKRLQYKNIPDSSGVYFFKKGKEILYIGKATSLRNRIKSYFTNDLISRRGPILVDMVFNSEDISWQETDSVLEALILEAFLIKKHQPKYNTKEKSNKSFNYVCITKDKKLALVRGRLLDSKRYDSFFGPFPNGGQLREALKIVRKIFPYIEEKNNTKGKEEFYKQIKLHPNDSVENKKNIRNIKLFFEGKKKSILKSLEKDMNNLARLKEFEKAGEIKRKIFALKHINDISLIKSDIEAQDEDSFRIEAYDIAHMSGGNMVGVMTVIEDREITKKEYKKFKIKTQTKANDIGALKEILERRFNHSEWKYPNIVVVDGGVAQINIAKKILEKYSKNIITVSVVKDDRHKPKDILGNKNVINKYKKEILLVNNEAHRFAISYHKDMRAKSFLKK